MNIGEIKKPAVDGQLVKPKQQVATAAPIESAKPISDQIDISIKARERFLQYKSKNKNKLNKEITEAELDEMHSQQQPSQLSQSPQHQSPRHIDIIA